jgi:hypothetical protein
MHVQQYHTTRITFIGVNLLVTHNSSATLLSRAAAWKTQPRQHYIRIGGTIVRPVALPLGGPDSGSDARVDHGVG